MEFKRANMPVSVAAKALGMDCQTVRILCQNGVVDWGRAFKNKGSRKYSYLISPRLFYESTGFFWGGESID